MEDYILELTDISKAFPGVKALSHVTMEVKRGEIMGLVGENGAGKSTLMKILTGVYQRDSGSIRINGTEARISNPLEAQKLGLSIIFQEMNLVDSLSIAENIFVGRLPKKGIWGIQWKEVQRNAEELLEKVGLKKNPGVKVELLSIAEKQMVEIAKALSFQARLIVMDEPSATLTEKEQRHLFDIVEVLKREGITVIYISHRLDEIFKLCDRVTILRDGQVIDTKAMGELTREQIITKMVGRELQQEYPPRKGEPLAQEVLRVENLSRENRFHNISFALHKGEILGIAGLVGAGRTEIVRCIFGADKKTSGKVWLHGAEISPSSPKEAIAHKIALVTEDRKVQGLVLDESIAKNISLAKLRGVAAGGFLKRNQEEEVAKGYLEQLRIKAPGIRTGCVTLSGGNQQKVVLAKWLYTEAEILILDEPTRGIDVGAKYEIYQLIYELVEQGLSVILISSELPEVIALCDRLLVIHEGELKGELTGENMTAETIMKMAILKGGEGA